MRSVYKIKSTVQQGPGWQTLVGFIVLLWIGWEMKILLIILETKNYFLIAFKICILLSSRNSLIDSYFNYFKSFKILRLKLTL